MGKLQDALCESGWTVSVIWRGGAPRVTTSVRYNTRFRITLPKLLRETQKNRPPEHTPWYGKSNLISYLVI